MKKIALALLVLSSLAPSLAGPVAADTLYSGIDLWATAGDGTTFRDFSRDPLPAGFFCWKSEPFAGRIVFRGAPVVTDEPGALGIADTIVERLDDAVFNARGVAVTRIKIRSLNLESVAPLETACGAYNARVTLVGEQPVRSMRIVRDLPEGGHFAAALALRVKLTFTPIDKAAGRPLELVKSFEFPLNPDMGWSFRQDKRTLERTRYIRIDSDGDLVPDTYVPGTSNFVAGVRPGQRDKGAGSPDCMKSSVYVHCTDPIPPAE